MSGAHNLYEKTFGIAKPKCCSTGDCCKGVSPSTPYHQLLKRAASGDEFARNFFSIMVPYKNHDEARAVVAGVVDKTIEACRKLQDFQNNEDDVVFYRCRYLQADNKCGIHEDRPQFCRDYPDTPFVVMSPNCAYVPWATACKKKYHQLKAQTETLKEQKIALEAELVEAVGVPCSQDDNSDKAFEPPNKKAADNWEEMGWALSLTDLYLSSSMQSFLLP